MVTLTTRGGAQGSRGARGEGEVRSRGKTALDRSEAGRHLRREEKAEQRREGGRKGERRAGGDPCLRSGGRAKRRRSQGRPSRSSRFHWPQLLRRPAFFLAQFPREEGGTPLSGLPVPRPARGHRGWGKRSSARVPERWGGSAPSAGGWRPCSFLPPPWGRRGPEPPLDFEPGLATWPGTGRAGAGRGLARGRWWPPRVWPAPPGGYVTWPEPRGGPRLPGPGLSRGGGASSCDLQLLFFFPAFSSFVREKGPNACVKEFSNHVLFCLPPLSSLACCVVPWAALGNLEEEN